MRAALILARCRAHAPMCDGRNLTTPRCVTDTDRDVVADAALGIVVATHDDASAAVATDDPPMPGAIASCARGP